MRRFATALLATLLFAFTTCSSNNDNAHTTATTIVPPPPKQELHITTRPSSKLGPMVYRASSDFDPQKPLLIFGLTNGETYRENEPVVIDFSLANATLKGDGGDYRVRYIVDDEEMRWIDRWEQVVLTGWTPGKHTIRLELVGPDGWPLKQGVATRELTITK